MTSTPLRETIRTALHDEWWRSIREKIEDAPEGHVERLTDKVMRALKAAEMEPCATAPEWVTIQLEDAQRLFDLATDSPLVCSGSFETDDVVVLRRLAQLIGVDPAGATPAEFVSGFPHAFQPYRLDMDRREIETGENRVVAGVVYASTRWETDEEVMARIGTVADRCSAGVWRRWCGRPADDPIHQAAEMGA